MPSVHHQILQAVSSTASRPPRRGGGGVEEGRITRQRGDRRQRRTRRERDDHQTGVNDVNQRTNQSHGNGDLTPLGGDSQRQVQRGAPPQPISASTANATHPHYTLNSLPYARPRERSSTEPSQSIVYIPARQPTPLASTSNQDQASGRIDIPRNVSFPTLPTLKRQGTMVRLERLNSRRRLLRADGDGPPIARQGATRSFKPQASRLQLLNQPPESSSNSSIQHAWVSSRSDISKSNHVRSSSYMAASQPSFAPPPNTLILNVSSKPEIAKKTTSTSSPITSSTPSPPVTVWVVFSWMVTCCIFPIFLTLAGKRDKNEQQAYREKLALCLIIAMCMGAIGFISLGIRPLLCPDSSASSQNMLSNFLGQDKSFVYIYGFTYDFGQIGLAMVSQGYPTPPQSWAGQDVSQYFLRSSSLCSSLVPQSVLTSSLNSGCASSICVNFSSISDTIKPRKAIIYHWDGLSPSLMVFNNMVININRYQNQAGSSTFSLPALGTSSPLLIASQGRDGTYAFSRSIQQARSVSCLSDLYVVGFVDTQTWGCTCYDVIMICLVSVVMGVTIVKFLMALSFHWILSYQLTRRRLRIPGHTPPPSPIPMIAPKMSNLMSRRRQRPDPPLQTVLPSTGYLGNTPLVLTPDDINDFHTIMFITCYSESSDSIKSTLSALAGTEYPDSHKLLFVVADGIITGSGNDEPTYMYVLKLMQQSLPCFKSKSYIAVATGPKQSNRASVYAGYYTVGYHHIPIICVVKEGCPFEATSRKPGNRGKRDSQVILMNFLSRLLCGDSMTELDYSIYRAILLLTGHSPSVYTMCLMVDADTIVRPDSVRHMIQAMKNDHKIMGLCGETRITNKRQSFWTMIQVYEYFISHHFGKSFESVFGGVTCLPGCFSMYRIKVVRKSDGMVIPLLVCPEVVEEYAENIVNTLHKQNLLLLGEDRFLTTLMLRSFPKRRLVFIPQSVCYTQVPDSFKVLLSQRRRWINSTIHNLFELVLLRELCGIFCFSMQFVIALELIGTVVLPASLIFTYYLVYKIASEPNPLNDIISLAFLLATVGLPGVLILVSSRKIENILWMLLYLFALPIWNFIIPLYSFWNFDDISWGQTRVVDERPLPQSANEQGGPPTSGRGDQHALTEEMFAPVVLKSFQNWESERRMNESSMETLADHRDIEIISNRTHVNNFVPSTNAKANDKQREKSKVSQPRESHVRNTSPDRASRGAPPRPLHNESQIVATPSQPDQKSGEMEPITTSNTKGIGISLTACFPAQGDPPSPGVEKSSKTIITAGSPTPPPMLSTLLDSPTPTEQSRTKKVERFINSLLPSNWGILDDLELGSDLEEQSPPRSPLPPVKPLLDVLDIGQENSENRAEMPMSGKRMVGKYPDPVSHPGKDVWQHSSHSLNRRPSLKKVTQVPMKRHVHSRILGEQSASKVSFSTGTVSAAPLKVAFRRLRHALASIPYSDVGTHRSAEKNRLYSSKYSPSRSVPLFSGQSSTSTVSDRKRPVGPRQQTF